MSKHNSKNAALQSELDKLFNDDDDKDKNVPDSTEEEEAETQTKHKRKTNKNKVSTKKQNKVTKPKIRTTQLIKSSPNNETRWLNSIKQLCEGLSHTAKLRIVIAYGNTGLLAYWFKTFIPHAEVILNDSDNVVSKLDEQAKELLKDVIIEHKDIDEYLIPYTDDCETVIVLNPREFSIKVIEFMTHKLNLIVIGSTKNKNTDYIHIFNNLISKLDAKYAPIPYSALCFSTEQDYMLIDLKHDTETNNDNAKTNNDDTLGPDEVI